MSVDHELIMSVDHELIRACSAVASFQGSHYMQTSWAGPGNEASNEAMIAVKS